MFTCLLLFIVFAKGVFLFFKIIFLIKIFSNFIISNFWKQLDYMKMPDNSIKLHHYILRLKTGIKYINTAFHFTNSVLAFVQFRKRTHLFHALCPRSGPPLTTVCGRVLPKGAVRLNSTSSVKCTYAYKRNLMKEQSWRNFEPIAITEVASAVCKGSRGRRTL